LYAHSSVFLVLIQVSYRNAI